MCAHLNSWNSGVVAFVLMTCSLAMSACSDSVDGPDLDALVSEGRVGSGGGGGVGVTVDAPDTSSADAGADVADGSGTVDVVDPDPVTDIDRHRQILQSARRSSDVCAAACPEAAVCVLTIEEELCVTSCANIPAIVDQATDDSVAALRCARSIETLWTCILADFTCEDYVYATDGRFTRCTLQADEVNDFCGDYGLPARSLLEL